MIRSKTITVNDKMQSGYSYTLTQPMEKNFDSKFKPHLAPKKMLELGVFGGKYMTDTRSEFPNDWFKNAKLSPEKKDPSLNYFKVDASMPLSHWQKKGWIYQEDPRGWFQWYCRYFMGRRLPEKDQWQIGRWRSFRRHWGAVKKNCQPKNYSCRPKQRQALLHWAYDSRNL